MDLNESPDCILSELVIVYTKNAIVFEKLRRECDVFKSQILLLVTLTSVTRFLEEVVTLTSVTFK